MLESPPIRTHQDPALFREVVNYTAAATGFSARLIEKDYFCTVLLQHLAGAERGLVFKGGTCLAKVGPQLGSQLKAVLRAQDFAEFDLDPAFATVADVAAALDRTP